MMLTCSRCGASVPRTESQQTRCQPCEQAVGRLIAADARRRTPRYPARDWTGRVLAR